jgi:acyl-coenzyme A synthetase/AMP-(fatty) acid ligase
LSSLQSISLGGERLPEPTYKKIKNTLGNIKVRNIYASTEAGSLLCSDGYGFEIPKRYLNLIKIDEDNTIIIHKSLMGDTSYQGDWYNTGDKVRFIDTKKFVFDSREKEYFNVGGNRVSPAKIEEQILMLSGVELCLVYPVKNSLMGNLVGIKVKKHKDYSETDLAKSIKFCDTLERYERPKIIDFVEDLQLTNTGKVKRI